MATGQAWSVLARLGELFLEPASGAPSFRDPPYEAKAGFAGDVEVVVVGLGRGCGTSTVSAGLALAFAAASGRDANLIALGAADQADAGSARLGPLRVWRVPRALVDPAEVAQYGGVVARIAGGRGMGTHPTATVWDLPASEAAVGAQAMNDVGTVVAVARGDSDPALSELAVGMLADRHERVLLVANRVASPSDWDGRACVCLPESRLAARLVPRGRLPSSSFAQSLRDLAGLLEVAS